MWVHNANGFAYDVKLFKSNKEIIYLSDKSEY